MANVKIRQEINILDSILSAAGGASGTSNEIIRLDTTQYNGATYYFEIIADSSISISFNVTLNGATDGTLATCNIPLLTTAYKRVRSSSFVPTTATQNCTVVIDNTAGATKNVRSAKIIILQNAASLTNTETQIEVGDNFLAQTNTAAAALTNPKYWTYTAANWDASKLFYAEVTSKTSAANTHTVTLQEDNGSFASWVDLVTVVNALSSPSIFRSRSASFTPTDGRHYRIAAKSSTTKSNYSIYNAKIIIDSEQTYLDNSTSMTGSAHLDINGGTGAETTQAGGQSFTTTSAYSVTKINLFLQKISSPTDNLVLEILSTSITGSVLGTANNVAASSVLGVGSWISFTFNTPVALSNSTKYYLRLSRTPDTNDAINYCSWIASGSNTYANGGYYARNSNAWGTEQTTNDATFKIFATPSPITKLESQYLLLNTADAGTGLQTYQTLWDSTEWDDTQGGLPTFKYSHDATNAADASKLVDITNANTDVTGATVTGANQQISAAFTMPTTGHELDTNVTVSTGVVGAVRILAVYTVNAIAAPTGYASWASLTIANPLIGNDIQMV